MDKSWFTLENIINNFVIRKKQQFRFLTRNDTYNFLFQVSWDGKKQIPSEFKDYD